MPALSEIPTTMLESLIGLILPLHQLLEAQEGLETLITDRLEEIMEAFGKIAASLQTTAEALGQIADREASAASMEKAFQRMELRLQRQDQNITVIAQNMQLLIDWLGGSPLTEAGPNF
jgi:actin-related protein